MSDAGARDDSMGQMTDEPATAPADEETASMLTPPEEAHTMPPHRQETGRVDDSGEGLASGTGDEPEATGREYRPYVFEEVGSAPGRPAGPRGDQRGGARGSATVELLRDGDEVEAVIVVCSCGERIRLEIDYGDAKESGPS